MADCEKEAPIEIGSGDEDKISSELFVILYILNEISKIVYVCVCVCVIVSRTSVGTEQHEPEPEHAEVAAAASTSAGGEAASVAPLCASSGLFKVYQSQYLYTIESGCKYAVQDVLRSLSLEHLGELFEKEDITMDVLVDVSSEDLQMIGVAAFGHRHNILKKVKKMRATKWQDCSSLTGMVYSSLAEQNLY